MQNNSTANSANLNLNPDDQQPNASQKDTKFRQKRARRRINKKVSTSCVMRAAARRAWENMEDDFSINTFLNYLPSIVPHHNPDKDIEVPFELPEWKCLPADAKACLFQLAMADIEAEGEYKLVPFTFRPSHALSDRAAASKDGRATYLQERLKKSLERALNRRPVDFWFFLEMSKAGLAHLHGTILLTRGELLTPSGQIKVKDAFHSINGDVAPAFKNRIVRLSYADRRKLFRERGQLYTDMNWALYGTKERGLTGWTLRTLDPDIEPRRKRKRIYSATHTVTRRGKEYFEALRDLQKAKR